MTSASPSASTHCSTSMRQIPIIIVPGIMGTRLAEPGGDHTLAWNPYGGLMGSSPGGAATNAERLQNVAAPLAPDAWNTDGYAPDLAIQADEITGFYELVVDSYVELAFAMSQDLASRLAARNLEPKVYCCGYDWRQNNLASAARLFKIVQQARAECGQEKVILIAHSMGGLVARAFCRILGGESFVRALFLVGSPSLGAVQPYAYLKRGVVWDDGKEMWALRAVLLGLSQAGSRDFMRAMPSMYQLMANEQYCSRDKTWLKFDTSQTGYPYVQAAGTATSPATFGDCSANYLVYKDIYVGMGEAAGYRTVYSVYVDMATSFHRSLSVGSTAYMHPETHNIYCTNIDTASSAHLPIYGTIENHHNWNEYVPKVDMSAAIQANISGAMKPLPRIEAPLEITRTGGDSSVPALSGNPPSDLLSNPFVSVKQIPDVAHGDLPNDPGVIDEIIERIFELEF